MGIVYKNNAKTTLASSVSNSATSLSVVDGSVFPDPGAGEFFLVTLDDGSNNEIVKCTARSSNTLTVVRAQESTTARAFSAGDASEGRVTAGFVTSIQENIAAKSANQTVYNATAASSATAYDIGVDPGVEANAMVFLDGVMQHHDTFSFSGSTLTFDAAPTDGTKIEVIVDNLINLQSSNLTVDTFTATSNQTAFTLSDSPGGETNVLAFIDGVFQNQSSYSLSSNTLTFDTGVVVGRTVTVYTINPVNIGTPSDGTVTSSKLSGNITIPGTLTVGSNNVAFDSPTFVVDHSNSRVGLGTATPSVPVDIVGEVKTSSHINIGGNLVKASGNLTLDIAGGITLDADGGQVDFKDNGTLKALIDFTGNNVEIQSRATDGDLLFRGQDGASFITALTLDMSDAGSATFNNNVIVGGDLTVDTNVLHVNSTNNNVGIGDASPPSNTKLAIQADGIGIRLDGTGNTTRTIFFRNTSSTNPAQIYADGSLLLRTEDANTDIRFQVNDNEKLRIGTNGYLVAQSASQVRLVLGSTGNSTNNTSNWVRGSGSEMDFNSASAGFNWEIGGNKKMRIDSGGKLGVLQTNPAESLHVGSGQSNYLRIHNAASGDVSSGIKITRGDNLGLQIYDNPADDTSSINASGHVNVRTNNTSYRLYIKDNGSVAVGGNANAGHSFEVQDRSDGYSMLWTGRSASGEGRGITNAYGLLGVNGINYDGDGAYYPTAGFTSAADNASGESVDFWFGTTTNEWQPMCFFCIGAHTSGGLTGQTAGWALIRATHYNNGVSFSVLDSGGGGTWTTSVQGSLGDDRNDTSRCRIQYSSSQNRTVLSVWGANYTAFYGATRS